MTATVPSVAELRRRLDAGEITVVEVVRGCLDAIADREEQLQAWVHLDAELVLERARVLDALPPERRGPLHGVPVGVKDIVDTADQPTGHGSPIYTGNEPDADAVAVARLRAAGAVVVGKTVTTEFALFQPGPTRNPHGISRTPGGSSSGSAAAVAAGQVPLAIGTQTAGSIVRPASFCGVFGAKPTFGAVPLDGVKLCSPSLDTVGLLGSDVDGIAVGLGVMADDPERFRPVDLGERPRIGFVRTPWWHEVERGERGRIETAVEALAGDLDVVEVELPAEFAGLVDAQQVVMGVEVLDALAFEIEHHGSRLSARLRAYLDDARRMRDEFDQAVALRESCRRQLDAAFGELDVWLAPSVLGEAPDAATTGDPLLCRPWTLLGTPTVAVPGLRGGDGLPLGLQTIARPGDDGRALGAARLVSERLAAGERSQGR
ncbi:amidase [Egicoccus halophilus]|uniref:Amidase n=1 Tax=Egicoccus halophilus TaxID=1670830 RepID=A0A8J3AD22_9ACTN|nr:amidase [Egicoccus halophilus]GGI04264.1 amidase [Egicoccus halophilus]